MLRGNLYIPSVDAKDLYLSQNDEGGYSLLKNGQPHLQKYVNSFDYSLDLIDLRRIAGKDLSFIINDKEYSSKVINVTFKYSVREFNKISKKIYVRNGYRYKDITTYKTEIDNDGVKILTAIVLDTPMYEKIPDDVSIPDYFSCKYDKSTFTYSYSLLENKTIPVVRTSKELRTWVYQSGFKCDGFQYQRFKRSSGSARVGKCLFIESSLYPEMHKAEQCGLDIHKDDPLDIAAFEAYISLPTSSIIDVLEIKPENILVIDDYTSTFHEDAVCTDLGEDGWLTTEEKDMEINNSIWDGESLIDISLMGDYASKGMLLLRNKFFKSCCFNTNIQQWFQDNGITEISQLNGKTIAKSISDIKLITTPSSIKFFKFGKYETWLENIYPYFGVVKFDKNTHYFDGRLVQAHYQLLNTLQLSQEEVNALVKDSVDYINLLNTNVNVMRFHLKYKDDENIKTTNVMQTPNDMVYNLLNYDCGFENTRIYYEFKRTLCRSYVTNIKRGHVLVNGTYATLLGNPYEMLQQSIGTFHGQSVLKPGTVHNIRFDYGKDILGSRSPHVTIGNILITKNVASPEIDSYFNLTDNIVCINSINENILERLSGADFDSDTMLLTDNQLMVEAAKKNYDLFKVPTRNINPPKSKRHYNLSDLADLDYKTSSNKIGEIVNLSQELNSLLWNMIANSGYSTRHQYDFIKEIYYDVCQLDVMSNIEIDKAKKEYPIDTKKELDKMRAKYSDILFDEDNRKMMPEFLGFIATLKNYANPEKKNYTSYQTTMDYLQQALKGVRATKAKGSNFTPLCDIFKVWGYDDNKVNWGQIKEIIDSTTKINNYIKALYLDSTMESADRQTCIKIAREDLLFQINKMKINEHTMYALLKKFDANKVSSVKSLLFSILFNYKNEVLIKILGQYNKYGDVLKLDNQGDISLYNKKYSLKVSENLNQ